MKTFHIFVVLIIHIGNPIVTLSENIATSSRELHLTDVSYKHPVVSGDITIMGNYLGENLDTTSLPNEIWKDIDGYEGLYQISNKGRLKRLRHFKMTTNRFKTTNERWLKEIIVGVPINNNKYRRAALTGFDKKYKNFFVHILVAKAFLNYDPSLSVNHKDGDKLNNDVDNLEVISQSENMQHAMMLIHNKTLFIHKRKDNGRYRVRICVEGKKQKDFGTFDTLDDAIVVRDKIIIENGIKIYGNDKC